MSERNEAIVALAREGKSDREIAKALGLTRGKVAGVVWRSGARLERRPVPAPAVAEPWWVTALAAGRCRFPLWESTVDHRYCGEKALAGKPYCEAHDELTHRVTPASSGQPFRLPV